MNPPSQYHTGAAIQNIRQVVAEAARAGHSVNLNHYFAGKLHTGSKEALAYEAFALLVRRARGENA